MRRRQIGSFRPLGIYCTRLRDPRKTWLVSKGRAAVFHHTFKLEHLSNHTVLAKVKKVCAMSVKNSTEIHEMNSRETNDDQTF